MPVIDPSQQVMTLINVFTVDPSDQEQLVELLVRATEETMRHLPGFVSASIHRSVDGAKVINYAQWRSQADFEAIRGNRAAAAHMAAAAKLATFEPIVCEVVDSVSTADVLT